MTKMITNEINKREQIKSELSEKGIEFIMAQFVDINGSPKVKLVPLDYLDDVVNDGAGFAGAAVWGMGLGPESSDLMARADTDTFTQLPWHPNVAIASCDLFVDGKPWGFCPRTNLKRMLARLAEKNMILNGGFEPEHFLVERDGNEIKPWDPNRIDTLEKPCYDFKGLSQTMNYLQDITKHGNAMGFGIYQSDHEDANGQYEINYGWTHAIGAADQLIRFRMLSGQVAQEHGAIATYVAKPFANKTGSGAHFHFHVADKETGANLFPLPQGTEDWKGLGMSKTAMYYVGGLLKHIRALTALSSPQINCYRRIQSGEFVYSSDSGYTWTPSFASYGNNNRTHLLRSPAPNRFEDRSPSSMVNPYLYLAAHIAAGLDGIENQIDPGEAILEKNVWDLPFEEREKNGMIRLPQNLLEATEELEKDEVIKEGLGPIADEYIRLKKAEWGTFMQHVTSWEIDRTLTLF